MAELQKHPYHSSKLSILTYIEKPGTGIFLMKERAKLYKPQTDRKVHTLSKRLSSGTSIMASSESNSGAQNKRPNLGSGMQIQQQQVKQQDTMMKPPGK